MTLSIKETLDKFKDGSLKVEEFISEKIALAKQNADLNCFITSTFDQALQKAREADLRYQNNSFKPLDGISVGLKDLFCTKGTRTTAGSKVLSGFVPTYESHLTDLLQNKFGGISLGKLNMDEFAMGSSNETSFFGNVLNPLDKERTPGGSSGGSAAVVAAGICQASLGSDTGGSIRQPASFVGIVGIKPTYGRCSRYGMISFASSLDQGGVFASSVEDAQLVLDAISSEHDPRDTTSVQAPNRVLEDVQKDDFVVGIPFELLEKTEQGRNLIKFCKKHFKVKDISLRYLDYGISAYYIIAPSEASSNLAQYDGVRYGYRTDQNFQSLEEFYALNRPFGDEVKRRIMLGTHVLSASLKDAYYTKARQIRRLISDDFIKAFHNVDFIITPTTTDVAFKLGEVSDPVQMYLNDLYTIPASLAGLPAMSIPYRMKDLPLGMHIIGNYWKESSMCKFARKVEAIIKNQGGVLC